MLAALVFAVLAAQASPVVQAPANSLRPAQDGRHGPLLVAETTFLLAWHVAWVRTQREEHARWYDSRKLESVYLEGKPSNRPPPRGFQFVCDQALYEKPPTQRYQWSRTAAVGLKWAIRSVAPQQDICPSWFLGPESRPSDERLSIDTSLAFLRRGEVRAQRARLLGMFDSADRARPGDDWITGQRVRLLLDQQQTDNALRVATNCSGTPWWCAELRGYVHAMRSDMASAESAFGDAMRTMPSDIRCAANDVRLLLDSAGRRVYAEQPCAEREAFAARLWLLADPLLSEPGNARLVDHHVRRTLLRLRSGAPFDERFNWHSRLGADAAEELVIRYGWPAFASDGSVLRVYQHEPQGFPRDAEMYVFQGGQGVSPRRLYESTFEYPLGRLHLVPSGSALANPHTARSEDWVLTAPPGADTMQLRAGGPTMMPSKLFFASDLADAQVARQTWRLSTLPPYWHRAWFPSEHFASPRALVQLPQGQVALLRRERGVLLATAMDVAREDLGRGTGDTVESVLIVAPHPDTLQRLSTGALVDGAPAVLFGETTSRPMIVGVEFPSSDPKVPSGRTRFGTTPPPSLASMRQGDVAISDPVLLRAPVADDTLPTATESVLRRMAGSNVIARRGRLGVYWETYGIAANDSVDIAVWIERISRDNALRRLGTSLRIVADRNTPVAMSWSTPQAGRGAHVLDGTVPVIGKHIVLDTSRLATGEYWLDIAVQAQGKPAVRSRTTVVVK